MVDGHEVRGSAGPGQRRLAAETVPLVLDFHQRQNEDM